MKKITKPSITIWGMFLMVALLVLSFSTGGNRSQYTIPTAAWSVTAGDIDMDGDNDIVVGHNYNSQTEWGGVSILLNNGYGYFDLSDSIFLFGWQPDILTKNLDTGLPEQIIAKYEDEQNENEYIAIINSPNFDSISYYSLDIYVGVHYKITGDINGDGKPDIVVASNHGQFWGVMYNDGNGNFSIPEYYSISNSYPTDIACGDLNSDGREDIVVCGSVVEIYFSTENGFQQYPLGEHELRAYITDIDNDNDMDIVGLTDLYLIGLTGISIYENLGDNSFFEHDEIDFQPSASEFNVSDMNSDSLTDLVVTSHFPDTTGSGITDTIGGIYILYNEGNYQFSEPQFVPLENFGESNRRSCCADFDGNGFNDIATIRYLYVTIPNLEILFNDGKGNFQEDPVSGIQFSEETTQNPLICYPNPFSSQLSIEINSGTIQIERLEIYDMKGRLVKKIIEGKNTPYEYKFIWNGKGLNGKEVEPGVYLVRLMSGRKAYTQRVIKIN